jgi:signal transduction histidine kinase
MEQLFGNIISNALKYRNKEEDSTLIVRAEKIPRDQIAELFAKPERYYSKISFVDNGIGFSPDYANKIFEVFQRLHQRAEFTGTGIGLAICKKIVENHHGHIFATSEPGEGATFIVYLPVRN